MLAPSWPSPSRSPWVTALSSWLASLPPGLSLQHGPHSAPWGILLKHDSVHSLFGPKPCDESSFWSEGIPSRALQPPHNLSPRGPQPLPTPPLPLPAPATLRQILSHTRSGPILRLSTGRSFSQECSSPKYPHGSVSYLTRHLMAPLSKLPNTVCFKSLHSVFLSLALHFSPFNTPNYSFNLARLPQSQRKLQQQEM